MSKLSQDEAAAGDGLLSQQYTVTDQSTSQLSVSQGGELLQGTQSTAMVLHGVSVPSTTTVFTNSTVSATAPVQPRGLVSGGSGVAVSGVGTLPGVNTGTGAVYVPSQVGILPRTPAPVFGSPARVSFGVGSVDQSSSSVSASAFKAQVTNFKGNGKVKGLAYLRQFETVARVARWDDDRKLMELVGHLEGKAAQWLARLRESALEDWSSFREAFVQQFDRKMGATAAVRLRQLQHRPGVSIEDYLNECFEAFDDAELDPESKLAKDYFLSGLRDELQIATRAHAETMDLSELARFAAAVDNGLQAARSSGGSRGASRGSGRAGERKERAGPQTSTDIVCFNCNEPGHKRAECPDKKQGADATVPAKPKQQATPSGSSGSAAKAATTFGASQGK